MRYKTRSNRSPQGLQRVYFTGYPDDFAEWLEPISAQILARQNCAVFYEEDPESPEDAENFESDLARMQLIVIPVSSRFLYRDCFARRFVFPFAIGRHIPVLPILTESDLASEFNRICGDLQCLDLTAHDDTAISYEEKLTRYLNSVLIGDETAQKVRDAFDAYIFLSYRKKDRRFAQELMRLIHKNDFCRGIAIWYDEFLVPGESFNQAIQDALKKSELFALVVTPNLLEQGNYVMQHEYPDASSAGMKILPAELQPTDRNALEMNYDAIPACVDSRNQAALADSLAVLLENVANPDNDNDPQHSFFIGLAYLGGIDVETDYDTALRLIEGAAERGLPAALQKLVDMYNSGEGVKRDYHKAIEWQRRLAEARKVEFEADPTEDTALDWLEALWHLGDALMNVGKQKEAESAYQEMLQATERCQAYRFPFVRRYLSICCDKLGCLCSEQGRPADAQQYYEQFLQIAEQLAAESGTVDARRNLSISYDRLGELCNAQKKLTEAQRYFEQSLAIREQLAAENGTVQVRRDLAVCCHYLGNILKAQSRLAEAQQYYEKALRINEALAAETCTSESQRDLSYSYDYLGRNCEAQGRPAEAQRYFEKSLEIRAPLAEETESLEARRDLFASYNNLGNCCMACGRLTEAQQYYEHALRICRLLADETGTVTERVNLSLSCGNLGDICKEQGRLTEAMQYYEQSLKIREQLAEETESFDARRDLSVSYDQLGYIYELQSRLPEAQQHYEQSLKIRQQLAEETGTVETLRDLYIAYDNLGRLCKEQGRLTEAQQCFEKALQICEQIAAEAETVQALNDLAVSHFHTGDAAQTAAEQIWHITAAMILWERLAEQCPDVPKYAQRRDIAKEALKNL